MGYIGGFGVRKMLKSLYCSTCAEALLGRDNHHARYLTLTHIKDNGGLIIPSDDFFKILKKTDDLLDQLRRVHILGLKNVFQVVI